MICLEGTTEIQGHSQVGGLGNGCRPRTPSRTTDANLDCAFVENALLFVVLKIGRALPPPDEFIGADESVAMLIQMQEINAAKKRRLNSSLQ